MGPKPAFFLPVKLDLQRVRSLIESIVAPLGYELVDVSQLSEAGRWLLRVLIDREGGVTVGDCQRVSREIETPLDVDELVPAACRLEVSSPGLDRPLVKERDFEKYAGREAKIETKDPIDGRRNFKGVLKGMDEGMISITVDGRDFRIPLGGVKKARLVLEGMPKGGK